MRLSKRVSIFVVTAAGMFGCGDSSSDDQPRTARLQSATLPNGADIMSCVDPPPAPDACDWLNALDGLYFGDITKIEMVESQMVLASGTNPEVATCPSGVINQAMAITVRVSDTVLGPVNIGSSFTFSLGVAQLDELEPRPSLHPSLGLIWGNDTTGGGGLKIGDRIGVPVHKSTSGQLGLLGEPLLTQDGAGKIVVQERAPCQEPVIVGLANAGLDELASEYADCGEPTSEALTRRTSFDEDWTARKKWAYAALCFDTPDAPPGCVTNTDCPQESPTCNSAGNCE